MKKILSIFAVLAALACINTSCQKSFNELLEGNSGFTLTATIVGGGTKVSAKEGKDDGDNTILKLQWQEGDVIIGFDNAASPSTYAFEVSTIDETGKANFSLIIDGSKKGSATSVPTDGTTMYMFYAPGMKATDIDVTTVPTNPSLTVDISNQGDVVPFLMATKGTVADGKLNLEFEVKTAVIGIKAPQMMATNANINCIKISASASDENTLNTKVVFSKDASGNIDVAYTTPGEISKAVNFSSGTTPAVMYIAACPIPDDKKSVLSFSSNNGEVFVKNDKSLTAGNYYFMTPTFDKRIIKVRIAEETKATFGTEGTFKFIGGEEIKVADGIGTPQDVTVKVSGDIATITTNLSGDVLTLIYPKDKANESGNTITAAVNNNVPATQTGAFADVFVGMATFQAGDTEAVLKNQNPTVIYKIHLPAIVDDETDKTIKQLKIKSLLPYLSENTTRVFTGNTAVPINSSTTETERITITLGSISASEGLPNPCYVCLLPGVKLSDLAFDAATATYKGTMKGIPEKDIADGKNTTATQTVYTIDANNWHEYVQIGTVKWATRNIGAENIVERGDYFAWGEVRGHKATNIPSMAYGNKTGAFDSSAFDFIMSDNRYSGVNKAAANGFSGQNAPFISGNNVGTSSGTNNYTYNTTLNLLNDAAYYNWGGPWQTPINTDITDQLVANATLTVKKTTDTQFRTICTGTSYGGVIVFFPWGGYGNGLNLVSFNEYGYYLTRTISSKNNAFCPMSTYLSGTTKKMIIENGATPGTSQSRYLGFQVRPCCLSSY